MKYFKFNEILDTTMERNTLMAKCYPRIKDYCREKHGLEFQVSFRYDLARTKDKTSPLPLWDFFNMNIKEITAKNGFRPLHIFLFHVI